MILWLMTVIYFWRSESKILNACQPVQFHFLHIKGHQDTKMQHPLTLPEQYNVECDHLAKAFVTASTMISTSLANPEFDSAQPHLHIAGKVICWQFLQALHENAAVPVYLDYLCKKNWSPMVAKQIHWEPFHHTIQSLPCNNQCHIGLSSVNNKLPLCTYKSHPHPGSTLCP